VIQVLPLVVEAHLAQDRRVDVVDRELVGLAIGHGLDHE